MRQTGRQTGPRPVPARPDGYAPELEAFYRQFFLPLVRRAVRKQGLSMEDAGDVVQDTFILALGKLDPSRNPKAWLLPGRGSSGGELAAEDPAARQSAGQMGLRGLNRQRSIEESGSQEAR